MRNGESPFVAPRMRSAGGIAAAILAVLSILLDAGVAGLTFFAQPVVGALLGVWLLGERLSPAFFIVDAILLVGVALITVVRDSREVVASTDHP